MRTRKAKVALKRLFSPTGGRLVVRKLALTANMVLLVYTYIQHQELSSSLTTTEPATGQPSLPDACNSAMLRFMPHQEVLHLVKSIFHDRNCSTKVSKDEHAFSTDCSFPEFGNQLLRASRSMNNSLLTVQVGGMDGKSNDPMYEMFGNLERDMLQHWLPVVFEPVTANFVNLEATYADLAEKGVRCPLLSQRAIDYSRPKNETSCTFCEFDTSPDAPEVCLQHPTWMKSQIGTLQCDWSRRFFAGNFETCILQTPLDCGPIEEALQVNWGISPNSVAMLQIDIEGYEYDVLKGMFASLPPAAFPPLVHFEQKVLKERDIVNGTRVLDSLFLLMRENGYALLQDGEDILSVLTEH